MLKTVGVILLLIVPFITRAQDAPGDDPCKAFVNQPTVSAVVPLDKKAEKKQKKDKKKDQLIPLSVVVCEVEQALDAYQTEVEKALKAKQESKDVDVNDKVLPGLATADFDFKTVVDTKATGGIGFYIFKFGGSYDKQTTNDVDFQYQPKSRAAVPHFGYAASPESFQQQLFDTITKAANTVKQQRQVPSHAADPLVFKQLDVTINYGVTWDVNGGISVPINIVTLTATLDRSKNNVQGVKLHFAPPDKPKGGAED
jgi:hypothetical protein